MHDSLTESFKFDYNTLIEEHTFYQRMTPRMQTELIDLLFSDFLTKFDYFFKGLEIERGFINELVIHLYARTFNSGEEI